MDSKLQEIIRKGKSEPELVRICQLVEGMLFDFNQETEENDAKRTELEEQVSVFGTGFSGDLTVVQNELDDLKERMLSTEMYSSKDTINVNNPVECQNGDLLGTILSFFNSNLQLELSPFEIKAWQYLGKPQQYSLIVKLVFFVQKNFVWQSKMSLRGIVNKTGYPVYLTERLLPKNRKLQLEVKQMGIKTVTNSCELQILCPRKESGVTFRQIHTERELLKLNNAALDLRNYSTVDNGRPGKRNNHDSTGFSQENKKKYESAKTSEENSGEHMVNA